METVLWKPLLLPFEFALNLLMSLSYSGLTGATKREDTDSIAWSAEWRGMMFWWKY